MAPQRRSPRHRQSHDRINQHQLHNPCRQSTTPHNTWPEYYHHRLAVQTVLPCHLVCQRDTNLNCPNKMERILLHHQKLGPHPRLIGMEEDHSVWKQVTEMGSERVWALALVVVSVVVVLESVSALAMGLGPELELVSDQEVVHMHTEHRHHRSPPSQFRDLVSMAPSRR